MDDKELLELFQAESDEHLQSLEEGLMQLERDSADAQVLPQVFRSAHSLKGAARMMGIGTVELLAHEFEDVLGGAARGTARLSPETIERLLAALDGLRAFVREAVSGHPAEMDLAVTLARLRGEELLKAAEAPVDFDGPPETLVEDASGRDAEPQVLLSEDAPTVPADAETKLSEKGGQGATASWETQAFESARGLADRISHDHQTPVSLTSGASAEKALETAAAGQTEANWKIETIRVDPTRLDALLAMAGELIVATTRARRGRSEFETLEASIEESARVAAGARRALHELERAMERTRDRGHSRWAPRDVGGVRTSLDREYGAERDPGIARSLRELRQLSEREEERQGQLGAMLARLRSSYDDAGRLDAVVGAIESAIQSIRLLPLSTIFQLFPRPVRDLSRAQDKQIRFLVEGGETAADKRILEELKDPLMHMVRNAIDHGIETPAERDGAGKNPVATLRLRGFSRANQVVVELQDDGRGLNLDSIRRAALRKGLATAEELAALQPRQVQNLIFAPGFSTSTMITDVSGRGVGLDVVRDNVERLRGTIQVESVTGQGCLFRLVLPVTLATVRVLLVRAGGNTYAMPVEAVESVQIIAPRDVVWLQGRETMARGGAPVPLSSLAAVLELPLPAEAPDAARPCVILADATRRLGLFVDSVIDEQEIILKPLNSLVGALPEVLGATILDTGEVCLVLQPEQLINGSERGAIRAKHAQRIEAVAVRKTILLVEDSITTRTQEKRILENAGYAVTTAVDGLDGWNKLQSGQFDAVVSDIEMPNMDGLTLAARIRSDARHSELPIILVTSLASDDDRRRGVEVGANAYLTKGGFDQRALLDVLRNLA